jgi:hypothetical protein
MLADLSPRWPAPFMLTDHLVRRVAGLKGIIANVHCVGLKRFELRACSKFDSFNFRTDLNRRCHANYSWPVNG